MTQAGYRTSLRSEEAREAGIVVTRGLHPGERAQAAALFWDAFSAKLRPVLTPEAKAHRYLARSLRLDHALCARDATGRLRGVAGIKTTTGGLLSGNWTDLTEVYGVTGALWRGPLLDLTSRAPVSGQMVLDGLFVEAGLRGQGMGSALIAAFLAEARRENLSEVRLDVADTNPRARALYLRHGFRSAGESRMGLLRLLFGFRSLEQMIRPV